MKSRDKLKPLNLPYHNAYSHQTYPFAENLRKDPNLNVTEPHIRHVTN